MTNKKSKDSTEEIKGLLPIVAPWAALVINVAAATAGLLEHYRNATNKAFMVPYTHVHYVDSSGRYICGDMYINKKHICDGRFLNVKAEKPNIDEFLKLGITKEQHEEVQKTLKQFNCEGPHE